MSNPVAALFDAILADNLDLIRDIIDQTPYDLNIIRNRDGRTPLMVASQTLGAHRTVQYFCGLRSVDIDLRDNDGETALYQAAAAGNCDAAETLIRGGAQVDAGNNEQITPLMIAAYNGHRAVCEILLTLGRANIDQRDSSEKTALVLASYEGHAPVVQLLLEHGASLNVTDKFGWTALMLAAYAGRYVVCKLLLDHGVDPSVATVNGKTAYALACEAGCDDIVSLLMEHQHTSNSDVGISLRYGVSGGAVATAAAVAATAAPASEITDSTTASNELASGATAAYPAVSSGSGMGPIASKSAVSAGMSTSQVGGSQITDMRSAVSNRTRASGPGRATMGRAPRRPSTKRTGLRSRRQRHNLPNFVEQGDGPDGQPTQRQLAYTHLRQHPRGLAGAATMAALQADGQPKRGVWEWFSYGITFCCFRAMLDHFGGMRAPNIQQAWREKVALCFIIFMISAALGFLTFGFSGLACQKIVPIFPSEVAGKHGADAPTGVRLMIVRGRLFKLGEYFEYGFHRPIEPLSDKDLQPTVSALYGHDISDFFPPSRTASGCTRWPTNTTDCRLAAQRPDITNKQALHCHTSEQSRQALMRYATDQYVAYSWQDITDSNRLIVYNQRVYDLGNYFASNQTYLGDTVTEQLRLLAGGDASRSISRSTALTEIVPCLDDQFMIGRVDGTTIGCFASNLVLIVITCTLIIMTLIKFVAAVAFDWFLSWKLGKVSSKPRAPDSLTYVILLVTCYSEDEAGLRTTFDSMARTTYSDRHRMLFVIADGDVTGAGNGASTPDLCLKLMDRLPGTPDPAPCSYVAIGDGSKQHNMAQVYIGYYACDNIRLPYMLIVKCGTPDERAAGPKAGNRGKRDSQLILMQWMRHVIFNEPMSPLEFDMFEKTRALMGVTPDRFDMVLMVDADTLVMPDALGYMVAAMERDPQVMGLCGETRVANKKQSWVTMIQVYEYYISHHLGKAFESIFGGVTCLPGCFCMYRIKAPKCDGYSVPVLANPDIVEMYSSNDTSTLHKKNLLLLGEDRYLTTLMLRAFPKRKMIYVPKAVCRTVVPDEFKVLLSQRRRWINSTIHNLMELILVPELCGIFCCSMHFIIFMELVGTVVLPAALIFLLALIGAGISGADIGLPLIFMLATLLLQALLVLFTTRKVVYVMWMGVFLLAMPIWNLTLPLYAFWHFDDFSWGATRKVDGPDGHGHGDSSGKAGADAAMDPKNIPAKRWHEWVAEKRDTSTGAEWDETADKLGSLPVASPAATTACTTALSMSTVASPPALPPPPLHPRPLAGGHQKISAPAAPASVISDATADWIAYASEALNGMPPSRTAAAAEMTSIAPSAGTGMLDMSTRAPLVPPPSLPVLPAARTSSPASSAGSAVTGYTAGPRGPRERPEAPRRR